MNDFNFCVYATIYGDFLESFRTLKEAFHFCKINSFNGLIIGRWNKDDNGNYTDTYTEIKRYPAFDLRNPDNCYHVKKYSLFNFLKTIEKDSFCRVTFYENNSLMWHLPVEEAMQTRVSKTTHNFFYRVNGKNNKILVIYSNESLYE